MQYILTNEQMRAADEYTIHTKGVPSETLMERAGEALARHANELCGEGRVLCVCGGGNNGGDGFICARLLLAAGREVEVVCMANTLSCDCALAKEKYVLAGGMIMEDFPDKSYALVVDCLLGTGFHGKVSEVYKSGIERINAYKKQGAKVLSADIPSGVNGDNGRVEEVAVCADSTLCMGEYKAGVLLGDGIDCAGEIACAKIGIQLPEKGYAIKTDEGVKGLLPMRKRNTHKGSFGRAAIVAGSKRYTGAAYLAMAACLRSGVGYTTLFVPENLLPYYFLKSPEGLLQPLCKGDFPTFDEETFAALLSYDAIAYGMGMGVSEEVAKGVKYLSQNYDGKLVLDADALHSIAIFTDVKGVFANKKCDVLITPHCKEFSRLTGEGIADILEKGLYAPLSFARDTGVNVYLKNAVSLLTDGETIFVNTSGNSGQAKGGSGDVLSGVIVGLCAQGLSTLDSARLGGYLVGKSAEIAAKSVGERGMLAGDIIACLGRAFLQLEG